jgi:hypothetical protein
VLVERGEHGMVELADFLRPKYTAACQTNKRVRGQTAGRRLAHRTDVLGRLSGSLGRSEFFNALERF